MTKYYVICKIGMKKTMKQVIASSKISAKNISKKLGHKVIKIYSEKQLKKLNWKQVKKRFPFLNSDGNIDRDSKINKKDCRPFNSKKQDLDDDMNPLWVEGRHGHYASPISGRVFQNYIIAREQIRRELEEQQEYSRAGGE